MAALPSTRLARWALGGLAAAIALGPIGFAVRELPGLINRPIAEQQRERAIERQLDGEGPRVRAGRDDARLATAASTRRAVRCAPSLAALIRSAPTRIDTELLFPTPRGKPWREHNFYRDVWEPARRATGLDPTSHEFRHSYVSHLPAAGIDDADLAEIAGHRVETMLSRYTHPLRQGFKRVRDVTG